MSFVRSLRAKTLLSVLVPTALGLAAVAIIALHAYERVARDVVEERDAELARVSAAWLSEELGRYCLDLQSLATEDDVQSLEVLRLSSALEIAYDQLRVFDAGIVVYDAEGVALSSRPIPPGRRGSLFPVLSEFESMGQTVRPVFSDIFNDEMTGEDVILVAVPIVGSGGEFKGALAGMSTIRHSLLGAAYADVLDSQASRSAHAYLVDGQGRVIYHRDSSQVGEYVGDSLPVMRATSGETGAVLTEDMAGEAIISGYAPVVGTNWGLVTQERWENVVGPIRDYSNLLLGLLVLGGVSSAALVFFSTSRVLRPIQDLTRGAQRIAGGDFDHTIAAQTGDEVQTLAQQFNAMASALKESHADLERRVAERTRELAALNAIAAVASSSRGLQKKLNDALEQTLEVTGIDAGGIYLRQEETSQADAGVWTLAAYKGLSAELVAEIGQPRVGKGFSGRVAQTGEPWVVRDLSSDPRLVGSVLTESGFRAMAAIPLASRERVWGALFVVARAHREFSEQDIELLTSVGDQIGVAIESARLFDAEQRRAEQFRVITEMGRQITSVLDVDGLLGEIVRLLKETFGYSQITIGLIEGDELVFKAGAKASWSDRQFLPPAVKVGVEGITGWVAGAGAPLLAPDVSKEPRYRYLAESSDTRSELAVPLKTKEGVIGVLNVESDQLDAFDESDLAVLQSLASQAAVAIENARLYEDTRRRLAHVTALQETAKAVASTLELDKLLDLIIQEATTLLQADGGVINLVDWERREDEVVAGTGLGASVIGRRSPLEGSLSGWVSLHQESVISSQPREDNRVDKRALRWLEDGLERNIRSAAAAPLTVKDQVMGTLVVMDKQGGKAEFDHNDLELLMAFANQAAAAIENARLFDAQQRRAEQFRLLSEVGARITSLLGVDELLDETARLVSEVLGYYLVNIGLIDGDDLVIEARAGRRRDDAPFVDLRLRVDGREVAARVARTGEPLLVPDVNRDAEYVVMPGSGETQSELAVPLKTKSGVMGVLDVQSERVRAFDESDVTVLQSLANLAAIAIEEARSFDAEQRRAEQFRVISEVGRQITSVLAIDDLLREIVRLVKETFGYYLVGISLIEGDELVIKAGAGPPFDDPVFEPRRFKVGREGVTGWVAGTGKPLLVPDVSQEPRYRGLSESAQSRSELCVPLMTKEKVIGVLNVESDELSAFDERDRVVLQSVAGYAAIALEEARLFDAEQRRAEQFRAISEMGHHITSILAVDELIEEIVHLLKNTLGYYLVSIALIEGDELVFKAGAGPRWDDPLFQPIRLKLGQEGITGWVAATGEPLSVPDVSQEPRYIALSDPIETRSELVVPLKTKTGVIGVLNVESDRLNAFDESDLAVLQSLAQQAAIAIENARLYEQAQHAAALEERSRLARDLHDAVTQSLFSASLIGEVVPAIWESDQEEGRQLLQELRQLTRGALAEMRTLLLELRPAALDEASLDELLGQLAEVVTGRTGVPVEVTVEGQCELPSDVHVALYRIAQEALNNVVKHAHASQVEVSLRCTATPDGPNDGVQQRAELLVRDNGRGFDPSGVPPDRLGLGIIHERVQAIGAMLEIDSQPDLGTQITVVWKREE